MILLFKGSRLIKIYNLKNTKRCKILTQWVGEAQDLWEEKDLAWEGKEEGEDSREEEVIILTCLEEDTKVDREVEERAEVELPVHEGPLLVENATSHIQMIHKEAKVYAIRDSLACITVRIDAILLMPAVTKSFTDNIKECVISSTKTTSS